MDETSEEKVIVKNKINFFGIFSRIREKLPTDKRKFTLLIILLAIPITVGLALIQQEIRSRASGPERKLVMGISVWDGGYNSVRSPARTLSIIDGFASQIGQYPGTWSIWTDFRDGSYTDVVNDNCQNCTRNTFPSQELLNGLTARNISPVIFMQSVGSPVYGVGDANNDPAAKKYSNASIANGSFDAYLTKWANDAKAYNKPVILRYDQEMNGKWFPWSKPVEGGNLRNFKNLHNTPENFVKSWQHIYNVIHPIAPKVKFFWCPIAGSLGSFTNYFPGNAYVDYVGFDAYEKPDSTARTMLDLYDGPIKKLRTLSNKPIIIGETGVDLRFPNRSAWLTNGYPAIYNNFPDVAAIIYFNMSNWDLSAAPEIRTAYANLAAQPKFQGRFPPFTASPPPTPAPTVNNPTGYHDGSNCSVSNGWTCDADNYNQPLDVHFYEGSTFLGAVTANQTRSDLPGAGVCGGTANHGFSFTIPQSLKDGNAHNITAYAINIGPAGGNPVLGNSPKTIQCAAPTPTRVPTPTPTRVPTPTPTPTRQLIAKADTWVEKNQPTVNNGSSEMMKSDGNPVQISYIKFNLSSLGGIDIQKAFLRLKVSSNVNAVSSLSPGMSVKIVLDNSWDENSINYNNRPALGDTLVTVTGAQQNGDFVEIDLTDFIKDSAGGIISLGLWNLGSDGIAFNTREASFGKPTLIISYR